MPMINFTNPLTLLLATLIFVLMLILAKETKKSVITAIMLFVFVGILVTHVILYTTGAIEQEFVSDIIFTMVFDLIFVLISFVSYLWVDDIEAKVKKKKSIDNSLNWFWNKV